MIYDKQKFSRIQNGKNQNFNPEEAPKDVIRKGLPESLPTAVQKSYFMLTDTERNVLNIGLQKYRPGQSEPILIGGENMLKPALRLMSDYRLRIDEIKGDAVLTIYTRWLESVQARGPENQEVYVSSQSSIRAHLARIEEASAGVCRREPGQYWLRSQYSIRLYAWAKKYVSNGKKRISLEDLRKVLGLESVKDAEGNVIQKAPLPIWANFRQRALDVAILEITKKTDLKIEIQSLERCEASARYVGDFRDSGASGTQKG